MTDKRVNRILATQASNLPIQPAWLVVATIDGLYVADTVRHDVAIDIERVVVLIAAASSNMERHAQEYHIREAAYSITVTDTGCFIYAVVGDEYVLSLVFDTPVTEQLHEILRRLPEVIATIKSALY
jgi:predicted regulator of Ras-like GTPase activity (Roadblock/LC7/MglB family)